MKIFRKNLIIVVISLLPIFYYLYNNDTQTNRKFVGFFSMTNSIVLNLKEKVYQPKKSEVQIKNEIEVILKPKKLTNHLKNFITQVMSRLRKIF